MRAVLAGGDCGLATDPLPSAVVAGLVAASVDVVFVPAVEAATDDLRDALLGDAIRAAATGPGPLLLCGVSRGARVSVALAEELGAVGVVAVSYPFHLRRDPDPGERLAVLQRLTIPVLLAQGSRDAMGNREQVRGYGLPCSVEVFWLEDANHSGQPRARSGVSAAQLCEQLAQRVAAFAQGLSGPAS